jgi:hypothetical protein
MTNTINHSLSDYLAIWQQLENGYWVLVRQRPAHTAKRIIQEWNDNSFDSRYYACFECGINPNN